MNYKVLMLAASLAIGIGIGSNVDLLNANQHGHFLPFNPTEAKQKEVPEDFPVPAVDLIVHSDPKGGWNLQVLIDNLKIRPEKASLYHYYGEGHAHLYINDDKITRLYDEWFHIPPEWLSLGEHEIKVTLSANNHKEYTHNGDLIQDVEVIKVFR